MKETIFKLIEEKEKEYTMLLAELIKIESPTEHKAGVDAVGTFMAALAKKEGFSVEIHREAIAGNALSITMNEEATASPVCFSAHMDTVHPLGSLKDMPVAIKDGRIYGPGACDCKGGIISAFLAMVALKEAGFRARPVHLLLQSDEETSSRQSEKRTVAFLTEKAKGACAFFNCEPHRRGLVTLTRKGISRYLLTIRGKAEHAAECYLGKNAIAEAAHKILALEEMKFPDGITMNCGLIQGGSAENTVAEVCSFTVDVRYATKEEMVEADAFIRKVASTSYIGETKCEVVLKSSRIPMERCERNDALLKRLNSILKAHGLDELSARSAGGGSDATYITASGIPCLDTFGVVGSGIHAKDEYAEISSLSLSAKMLALAALYL